MVGLQILEISRFFKQTLWKEYYHEFVRKKTKPIILSLFLLTTCQAGFHKTPYLTLPLKKGMALFLYLRSEGLDVKANYQKFIDLNSRSN